MRRRDTPSYSLSEDVDFVVIGSGAAGGVMAKELSTAGFSVVVLEQGPYLTPDGFRHDEIGGREARGLGSLRSSSVLTRSLLTLLMWQAAAFAALGATIAARRLGRRWLLRRWQRKAQAEQGIV